MAIAAVPLLAGAGGTAAAGGAVMSVMGATAAATAAAGATVAATAGMGMMVGLTALTGAMMLGSMSSGGDDAAPQTTVEELDPTATDELETEQERNANLRRKIYSKDNLLSKETADETEGLTLLGA